MRDGYDVMPPNRCRRWAHDCETVGDIFQDGVWSWRNKCVGRTIVPRTVVHNPCILDVQNFTSTSSTAYHVQYHLLIYSLGPCVVKRRDLWCTWCSTLDNQEYSEYELLVQHVHLTHERPHTTYMHLNKFWSSKKTFSTSNKRICKDRDIVWKLIGSVTRSKCALNVHYC